METRRYFISNRFGATLKRIRDYGVKGFYEGKTAKLIVEEMKRGNGLMLYDDLKNYIGKCRKPVEFDYKGYHVVSMPIEQWRNDFQSNVENDGSYILCVIWVFIKASVQLNG